MLTGSRPIAVNCLFVGLLSTSFLHAQQSASDNSVTTTPVVVTAGPNATGPVKVSSGRITGMIVSKPEPEYPAIAKAAHVQGAVVLHAIISKEGTIENLSVISGNAMLVNAARDAVSRWRYAPYLLNGEPVEVDTTISVNFTFGDSPATQTGTADNQVGRAMDMAKVLAQTQNQTDEQAVCLKFIQRESGFLNDSRLQPGSLLPIPKVDCYDHRTYTHVNLTVPSEGGKSVRGVIMHDGNPSSCVSGNCAISLFVQGCPGSPGDEGNCRNDWTQGITTTGSDMQLSSMNHGGWYDVVVTATRSPVAASALQQTTYQRTNLSTYESTTEIAETTAVIAAEKKAYAAEAVARHTTIMSLGLHSGQTQAQVKAILIAHGYHSAAIPGSSGPWYCSSNGWANGRFNTSCMTLKGDIKLVLVFELGIERRDPDTAAIQQVRMDRLNFANFEFPYHTITLVERALDPLRKCTGEEAGNGSACLNF